MIAFCSKNLCRCHISFAYCSGSEDFYAELLCDLAAPEKKEEFQSAYISRDMKLYAVKAHALKGAAKTLGLEGLRAAAEGLQKAAENGDSGYIDSNHGKAAAILDKLAECTKQL